MKISFYLSLIFLLTFISCNDTVEGPQGIPGRDGYDGIDGLDGEEAYVFEYEVDFRSPDYAVLIDYPNSFYMLSSDVVQVYLLWNVVNNKDVWRALPQTVFTNDGLIQYNYDFTVDNVSVFMDAEMPFSSIASGYLLDQVLRVVVIPGKFYEGARLKLDLSDYYAVEKHFNLKFIKAEQK